MVDSILNAEHRDLINKKIKKAINEIDFTEVVREYVDREFESIYEESVISGDIEDMVRLVIKQHLVKSGLLKEDN